MSNSEVAVRSLVDTLRNLLDDAKKEFESDPSEFGKSKIFRMARYINLNSDLLNTLKLHVTDDIPESLEEFDLDNFSIKDFKSSWNDFLNQVEQFSFKVIFN